MVLSLLANGCYAWTCRACGQGLDGELWAARYRQQVPVPVRSVAEVALQADLWEGLPAIIEEPAPEPAGGSTGRVPRWAPNPPTARQLFYIEVLCRRLGRDARLELVQATSKSEASRVITGLIDERERSSRR